MDGAPPTLTVADAGHDQGPLLTLDAPRDTVLAHAARLMAEAWRSFDHFRPDQPPIDDRVRDLLAGGLPPGPHPAAESLDAAAAILDESIAQPRPRYFAFVGSSGLEIGVVADALAACYDVNLAVYAAAATEVERQAARWVGELIGYPAEAGTFTSGGTISNITALAAARSRALHDVRRRGIASRPVAVYCSHEAHYSVVRAIELLGIGSEQLRSVPIDGHRRMRADALRAALDRDIAGGVTPIAVVATAGTTLTGAVDPLDEIAAICAERGVWLHVDGAYGLPAAAVPRLAREFRAVALADSISLDAHKWLYMPKACGIVLVRDRRALANAFAHDEDYLPHDHRELHAVDLTLEYSRPFRALKCWLAFRVHGADAFRAALERNLDQAALLYREVEAHPELEPLSHPPALTIVPFRHVPPGVDDVDAHNLRLAEALQRDGLVFVAPATIDGRVYLRPCIVNFRTTDDDVRALVSIAAETGRRLADGPPVSAGRVPG
jgi:aromatic-L-amino-acid/L-tryptophan decarboxylase